MKQASTYKKQNSYVVFGNLLHKGMTEKKIGKRLLSITALPFLWKDGLKLSN